MCSRITQVFALVFVLFLAFPAQSQQLKPMPKAQKLTLAQFAAASTQVRRNLTEDPSVDLSFSLPSNYIERPFDQLKNQRIGKYLYGELVRFDGAPVADIRPFFRVTGQMVPREISPRLWLMTRLLAQNNIIRSFNQIDPTTIEAVYVSFENNISMAYRLKAWLQGQRMLVAEFAVPIEAYEKLIDAQFYTLNSVKLMRPINEPIEDRTTENFWGMLTASFPKSWLVTRKDRPSPNQIEVEINNPDENSGIQGQIGINIISAKNIEDRNDTILYPLSLPEQLEKIKTTLQTKKMGMDKRISRSTPKLSFKTNLAVTEVYEVRARYSNYETARKEPVTHELWITVIRPTVKPERAIFITLLTPARGTELYKWAMNTKAYEIMLSSLGLPEAQ